MGWWVGGRIILLRNRNFEATGAAVGAPLVTVQRTTTIDTMNNSKHENPNDPYIFKTKGIHWKYIVVPYVGVAVYNIFMKI